LVTVARQACVLGGGGAMRLSCQNISYFFSTPDAASTMLGTNGHPMAGADAAIRSWIPQAGPVSAATTFTGKADTEIRGKKL
jgi:hypothetical protein